VHVDVVIVPNNAIAKMRILNHSAGSRRYGETLTVLVDSRNDPELTLEILKQAALACPSILEHPAPSADATEFRGDRISYDISFSTSSIASAGEARSQLKATTATGFFPPFRFALCFPDVRIQSRFPTLQKRTFTRPSISRSRPGQVNVCGSC
jgi:small-conductance mechanosensitive channel